MAPPLSGLLRFAWLLVWTAHAVGAVAWWWSMPQGFPPAHLKFVANTIVPAVLFLVSTASLGAALRPNVNWVASFAAFPLVFWMMLGAAWYYLCPLSIVRWGTYALPGLLVLLLIWFATRRVKGGMTLLSLVATLIAALSGIAVAFAQRGPDASTHPYQSKVLMVMRETGAQENRAEPKRPFRLDAEHGQVTVQHDGVTLHVLPLLSFMSRSPDRCWSILAPKGTNSELHRQLMGVRETTDQLTARYMGDGESAMIVKWDEHKLPVAIETMTGLDRPTFSHINSYCILSLRGLKAPRLKFSPCAETPVDVQPADYPTGRPARFGYFDATSTLHVVEAHSGEKGPFKTLASGVLKSGDPLTLTILDGEAPKLNVVLLDFASQASVELSPTAGWGVPQNAIEFNRDGEGENEKVTIWFTLAGTSVGRGWDTVGHGVGTYRNRMRIEAP